MENDLSQAYIVSEEQAVERIDTEFLDDEGNVIGGAARTHREDPRDTSLEVIVKTDTSVHTYIDRRRDGTNHQVESSVTDEDGSFTERYGSNGGKERSYSQQVLAGSKVSEILSRFEKGEVVTFQQKLEDDESVDTAKLVLDKATLLQWLQSNPDKSITLESNIRTGAISISVASKDDGVLTTQSLFKLSSDGGITIESRNGSEPYSKLSFSREGFSVIMPSGVRITTDEDSVFIVSGSSKIAVDKQGGIILENGSMLSLDKTFGLLSAPAVEVSAGAMNITTKKLSFGDTASPVKYKVPKYENLYQKLRMLTLDLENLKRAFSTHTHPAPSGITGPPSVPVPTSVVRSEDFDSRRSQATDAFMSLEGT